LAPEAALALLESEFNPRCRPEWSARELAHKVEDADRVPCQKPRGWLAGAGNGRAASGFVAVGAGGAPTAAAVVDPEIDVSVIPWPAPLAYAALHGLAGEVVEAIDPHTEADPAAILFQFLVAFGNMAGRHAFYRVESSRHYPNLFAVLVGQTSRARKGTSWQRAFRVLERGGDAEWARDRVVSGLSSGEGLIWEVRDPVSRRQPVRKDGRTTGSEVVEVDPGVNDKRALVIEEEFASVLQVGKREGSILGSVLRSAWDTGRLGTLVKSTPARATGAHISIISHITRTELIATIHQTQAHNGFLNRFLWVAVRRSKLLPYGGNDTDMTPLAARLEGAWRFASEREREITMTPAAGNRWGSEYERLTADRPGLLGAVTSRSEAQALRLALVYALLDRSEVIDVPHLDAALAAERYVAESARHTFGDATGDPFADEILSLLKANAGGVGQLELINHFGRNRSKAEFERALGQLVAAGMARSEKTPTGKRPKVTWHAKNPNEVINEVIPGADGGSG
jgi:hypothetical protein